MSCAGLVCLILFPELVNATTCSWKESKTCRFLWSLLLLFYFNVLPDLSDLVGKQCVVIREFSASPRSCPWKHRGHPAQATCLPAENWDGLIPYSCLHLTRRLPWWSCLLWAQCCRWCMEGSRCCFLETYLYKCPDADSVRLTTISVLQPLISIHSVACSSWQAA